MKTSSYLRGIGILLVSFGVSLSYYSLMVFSRIVLLAVPTPYEFFVIRYVSVAGLALAGTGIFLILKRNQKTNHPNLNSGIAMILLGVSLLYYYGTGYAVWTFPILFPAPYDTLIIDYAPITGLVLLGTGMLLIFRSYFLMVRRNPNLETFPKLEKSP